jgi:pre-mRNA-processing factor 17
MESHLGKRIGRGYIEATSIDEATFNEQYQTFQRSGYAIDSLSQAVIGDYNNYLAEQGVVLSSKKKKQKTVKEIILDDDDDEALGPWATYKEVKKVVEAPVAPSEVTEIAATVAANAATRAARPQIDTSLPAEQLATMHIIEPEEEDEKWERKNERKLQHTLPPRPSRGSTAIEAKTTFHGTQERDFQGRSWMTPPQGIHPEAENPADRVCYIPKKCVTKLTGHTKGVQAIEYFPQYGHLLLSASMDGTCKIWDVQEHNQAMRTYAGHSEGIRSMQFNNNGTQFITSAFDRYIRLWDTETGQSVGTYSNRKMGYTVRFYPHDNNIFLAASSDNKIYQWDTRSNTIVQEYNYHLQACNTLCFIDGGKKFITTSDDKKVLVWEYDIPVPIKYIAEPDMHNIPYVTTHPTESYFVGQSMDNKIVVYTAGEKVKCIKKKVFKGHNNSGFGCQIGFSPNGQFLMSGDGLGQLYFWDWKTTRIYRKFQAHEGGPCMGAVWHPLHANRVATCGWDGMIKIWE